VGLSLANKARNLGGPPRAPPTIDWAVVSALALGERTNKQLASELAKEPLNISKMIRNQN